MTDPHARTTQVAADSGEDDLVLVCRSAHLTRPAYRFYRDILLSFPTRGRAPDMAELASMAAHYGIPLQATLARLAAQDLVQRDPATGAIRAAYPFSGVPTAHRVRLAETSEQPAIEVYAMCAMDALGIPLMLRRPATASSSDVLTGESVRVSVIPAAPRILPAAEGEGWSATWEPAAAVVVARPAGHEHEHASGCEAAGTCCPITNFFTSITHAQQWIDAHPDTDVLVFAQDDALRHAAALFAGVLDRLPDEHGQ